MPASPIGAGGWVTGGGGGGGKEEERGEDAEEGLRDVEEGS